MRLAKRTQKSTDAAARSPYREDDFEPGPEFTVDTPVLLAQLAVFPGVVSFAVP